MPKLKKKEAGSLSKTEHQKLQRLYTQGGGAYGSVRNLVKASNLPVSKVRHFLLSKSSYTKFILATRKIKHIKAFARFKNEIWCMDLAFVDKLSKDNNGVKYLLFRQDPFDRTVDSKGMKTTDSKETVSAFLTMIRKKIVPKILGWQWMRICSRFSKTMQSWRNINLFYDEWDQGCICWTYKTIAQKYTLPLHGRQWVQIHSQIDSIRCNTNFWKKLLDRLDTQECKEFRHFVHFFTANHYKSLEKPCLKLETEFASRRVNYLSGRVRSHSLHKRLSKLLQFLPENLQLTE